MSITLFVSVTRHLRSEFLSRFRDICSREIDIGVFGTPFDIQVDAAPEKYQMTLIELQCSNEIKLKFHCKHESLLGFYKKYLESKRYSNFVKHVKKMASIFGTTYVCEQLFSTMKLTKTKLGAQPTDEHLQDVMLLSSSTHYLNFKNFLIKHNLKYSINVFLPVSINVCCIL